MRITPPPVESPDPLTYKVRITGSAHTMLFHSLGRATRYVQKLTFAGQSQENIYIDEYYGIEPTGIWYRYDDPSMSLIKNTV